MNLITSESVAIGHPDKMCDLISDSILREFLKGDKDSRVACEVMATSDKIIVSGEVTSKVNINIEKIVRDTIIGIGYDNDDIGYNGYTIPIEILSSFNFVAALLPKIIVNSLEKLIPIK